MDAASSACCIAAVAIGGEPDLALYNVVEPVGEGSLAEKAIPDTVQHLFDVIPRKPIPGDSLLRSKFGPKLKFFFFFCNISHILESI